VEEDDTEPIFNNVNLADVMLLFSGSGIMLKDELEDYVAEPWIH